MSQGSPTFDLVTATVTRVAELGRLFDSLRGQTYHAFRVVVVDQNEDGRLTGVLADTGLQVLHLRSPRGLSRARNVALAHLTADVIAFPDDDCVYPPDLLERVAARFAAESGLDGLSVRTATADGRADRGWSATAHTLTTRNVWNLVASAGIFLRRDLVERVGAFDERLGVGSGEPWCAGEETDYVIRALRLGARVEYDVEDAVLHALAVDSGPELRERARREGATVGYLLRKHGYPPRTVARMASRPVGGAVVSLAHANPVAARFHVDTLRGRVRGYLGARRSKISA